MEDREDVPAESVRVSREDDVTVGVNRVESLDGGGDTAVF